MNKDGRIEFTHELAKQLGIKGAYPMNQVKEIVIKFNVRPQKSGWTPGWRVVLDEKSKKYGLDTKN